MVLVIDNYDSFTYNLVQYLGELGAEVRVFRNDRIRPASPSTSFAPWAPRCRSSASAWGTRVLLKPMVAESSMPGT